MHSNNRGKYSFQLIHTRLSFQLVRIGYKINGCNYTWMASKTFMVMAFSPTIVNPLTFNHIKIASGQVIKVIIWNHFHKSFSKHYILSFNGMASLRSFHWDAKCNFWFYYSEIYPWNAASIWLKELIKNS